MYKKGIQLRAFKVCRAAAIIQLCMVRAVVRSPYCRRQKRKDWMMRLDWGWQIGSTRRDLDPSLEHLQQSKIARVIDVPLIRGLIRPIIHHVIFLSLTFTVLCARATCHILSMHCHKWERVFCVITFLKSLVLSIYTILLDFLKIWLYCVIKYI